MKKMILSVAMVLATVGTVQANNYVVIRQGIEPIKQDELKTENNEFTLDSTQYKNYITAFYDVDRIVIKNNNKEQIRIYNSSWDLIKETNESVSINLTPGNYYVETRKRVKAHYISTD